jgi:hypothetical protein
VTQLLRYAKLPEGFPRLRQIAERVGEIMPIRKPDTTSLGLRLRRLFEEESRQDYAGIRPIHLRRLPYAYFLDGTVPLHVEHPELVRRYWATDLPSALASSTRRARRWLTPLLLTYIDRFDPVGTDFAAFSKSLQAAVNAADTADDLVGLVKEAQSDYRLLQPSAVSVSLAARIRDNVKQGLSVFPPLLLKLNIVDTHLGVAVLRAFLNDPKNDFRDRSVISCSLSWVTQQSTSIGKSSNRAPFAERVLLAWQDAAPPDDLRRTLTDFLIRHYTDPRIGGNRQVNWHGISPQALNVLMRWLAGDALRAFMNILERTADKIWEYRRTFWMAYYEAGYVDEVWLALGKDARSHARNVQSLAISRSYGSLSGVGVKREHSVLLIKIGGLVFSEWSHDGSLRVHEEDDSAAPTLYKPEYDGEGLRNAGSMDFHDQRLTSPKLTHHGSEYGYWQRIARDFIKKHTGIYLKDSEIT